MKASVDKRKSGRSWKVAMLLCVSLAFLFPLSTPHTLHAQKPGTTPVKISQKMQMMHGRKYYVHIVERGQTVYSIAKAYKVESYDAVTHVDIHFLHAGDTVWLPCRGQFSAAAEQLEQQTREQTKEQPAAPETKGKESTPVTKSHSTAKTTKGHTTAPSRSEKPQSPSQPPAVRPIGKTLKVALMMPLYLDQIDEISTSKFDIEQRGKKSYRQFEFIEFYEGVLLALDQLTARGISIELNVVDVPGGSVEAVQRAFSERGVAQADFIVALLLRDAFDRAAQLAQDSGVYIVNPMATRSEICATNPYMVKIQASTSGSIAAMLDNMHAERPNGHLYILHSGSKGEKAVLDELKRQLGERKDIKYTLFNWNQSAKLLPTLKSTPNCNVVSVYEQGKDNNRVFASTLLNRLGSIKSNTPTLYTLNDWTRDFTDIDFAQLQLVGYHTFSTAWDMTNQVHVDFLRAFRERFGTEPTSPLAPAAYDLMLYLCDGLHRRNTAFWSSPTGSLPELLHPLHLGRQQAGLENDQSQLFRMEDLRFIPAQTK